MRQSEQLFIVRSNFAEGQGGATSYGKLRGAVKISVDENIHSLVHELKHGYQFISGQISFSKKGGGYGKLADIGDEVAAYQREAAFDTQSVLANPYSGVLSDITGNKVRSAVDPYSGDKPYSKLKNNDKNIFNYKFSLKGDFYIPKIKTVSVNK